MGLVTHERARARAYVSLAYRILYIIGICLREAFWIARSIKEAAVWPMEGIFFERLT